MRQYIVYRHGWNPANQDPERGMPKKQAVLRVEADSEEEACRLATGQVSIVGEQFLTAEVAADVDAKEEQLNSKAGDFSSMP